LSRHQAAASGARWFETLERRRLLAFTSALAGLNVTLTGDEDADTLVISQQNGLLRHNRFTSGDAGFDSDFDFDSAAAGVQTVSGDFGQLIVRAGAGDDSMQFETASPEQLSGYIDADGEAGVDTVTLDDTASTVGDLYTLSAGAVSRTMTAGMSLGNIEGLTINAGTGNDVFQLVSTTAGVPLTINAGDGNDILETTTTPLSPVTFNGGLAAGSADEVRIFSGNFTFNNDAGIASTALTVRVMGAAGAIFKSTQHLAALLLQAGGTASVTPGGNRTLVVKSLTISGGRLDLGDNAMVVEYTGASPIGTWNGSSYTGLSGLIALGRSDGHWDGPGIVTTQTNAVGNSDYTTIGIAEASDALGVFGSDTALFNDQTVDSSAVLIKYTYGSDANLNGVVDIDDYGLIDFNTSTGGSLHGFYNGDFNYDGLANIDDYGTVDFTYSIQGAPIAAAFYDVTAGPPTVEAGEIMTVSWTASGTPLPSDWIGLYRVGDHNEQFLWWQYTEGASNGSFPVTAPYQAGTYELRALRNDTFNSVASSSPIVVNGENQGPPSDPSKPGPDNTGPTNPGAMQVYNGILEVYQDGAVIENIHVIGQVRIYANNVTMRNFKVTGIFANTVALRVEVGTTGTVLEDGEIIATAYWVDGLGTYNTTARRLDIHQVHDGIKVGDGSIIEDCWIHALGYGGGGHSDGIQTGADNWPVIIRRNFIDATWSTSALNGVGTNWIVEDNWLYGWAWTIFYQSFEITNTQVLNNRFGGTGTPDRTRPATVTWTGNVWDQTDEPIP
jgi:hypothetical protein